MDAAFLSAKFELALPYDQYVQTGTDEQQRRWKQVYDAAGNAITPAQRETLNGFVRDMNVLIISGIWCGDCVQQCPLIQRLAEVNAAKVHVRLIDRDEHKELSHQFRVNAGDRVPVTIFLSEDFAFCGAYGDRTLHRYRAIARRQLGASCPTGLAAPDADELAATTLDWMNEIERMQLMMRLSPRLRARHID
ncbi:MAG: thioredoxin family protein [Anaerolineae bacterium]|nr:thioredoxin family protein [Phycisphaerae bacterium]